MHKYFELYQARTWALYALNYHNEQNIHIHLHIKDVDQTCLWFLKDIPQYAVQKWYSKHDGDYIIFDRDYKSEDIIKIFIHLFTDNNSVYVGLYDEFGKLWNDICLIIWDKNHPEVTNPGYASGRCPDRCYFTKN